MKKIAIIAVLTAAVLPGPCMGQAGAGKSASAGATLAQAKTDLHHGKNANAIAILQKLAAANPQGKGVQHALGVAYYRTGKLEQARQAFTKAIAQNPQDIESVQLEGLTLFRMGQARAAIPTSPHPRQRLSEIKDSCATLTISLVQITGQASGNS